MKTLVVVNRWATGACGTFGHLEVHGAARDGFTCWTMERPGFPWVEENAVRVSRVPAGTYTLRLGRYHRGGYPAYELLRVPGRSLIKIHRGNTYTDVLGCIVLGEAIGLVRQLPAVVRSTAAFSNFMDVMGGVREAELVLHDFHPNPSATDHAEVKQWIGVP